MKGNSLHVARALERLPPLQASLVRVEAVLPARNGNQTAAANHYGMQRELLALRRTTRLTGPLFSRVMMAMYSSEYVKCAGFLLWQLPRYYGAISSILRAALRRMHRHQLRQQERELLGVYVSRSPFCTPCNAK